LSLTRIGGERGQASKTKGSRLSEIKGAHQGGRKEAATGGVVKKKKKTRDARPMGGKKGGEAQHIARKKCAIIGVLWFRPNEGTGGREALCGTFWTPLVKKRSIIRRDGRERRKGGEIMR